MSAKCFSFWGRRDPLPAWALPPDPTVEPLGYIPQLKVPCATTDGDN